MYAVVFHAHQKIDRIAYRHLRRLIGQNPAFPKLRAILHFEGHNGPDAPKLKNKTGVEPPWHFVNPFDVTDTDLGEVIDYHYRELVRALTSTNPQRIAFEAAWLAHALVDGLTPAHHYPYEAELEQLRGEDRTSRNTILGHLLVQGENMRQSIMRSLKLIGPKGLLTTHTAFEAGVFSIILPLKLNSAYPKSEDIDMVRDMGLTAYFHRLAREVAARNLYVRFYRSGWTPRLARLIRKELAPRMVLIVTLAWYSALCESGVVEEKAA